MTAWHLAPAPGSSHPARHQGPGVGGGAPPPGRPVRVPELERQPPTRQPCGRSVRQRRAHSGGRRPTLHRDRPRALLEPLAGRHRGRRAPTAGWRPRDRAATQGVATPVVRRARADRIGAAGVGRGSDPTERTAPAGRLGDLAGTGRQEGAGAWVGRAGRAQSSTSLARRPGQEDACDIGPWVGAAERGALRTGQDRPGTFGEWCCQTGHGLRPSIRQAANGIHDALQVIGRFAGLDHGDGDVHEGLERRQGLDRPGSIDGRGYRTGRPVGRADDRLGYACLGNPGLDRRRAGPCPVPAKAGDQRRAAVRCELARCSKRPATACEQLRPTRTRGVR